VPFFPSTNINFMNVVCVLMRTLKINKTMRTLNANCTGQAVSTRWSRVLRAVSWDLGPRSLVLGPDRMCQLSKETVGGVGSNYEDIMSIMPRNRYCVDMLGPP